MKRKSPTPWLPFSSRLLLRPLPGISLAKFDLDPLSHHHSVKDIIRCRWRFIHTWAITAEINIRNRRSSDSLNGSSWSPFIFVRSTIPMISGDFLRRWNAITVGKGRGKGQFWGISYFWIEVFLKEVLGLLPYEEAYSGALTRLNSP